MSVSAAAIARRPPGVDDVLSYVRAESVVSTTACAGICVLLLAAPFEALQPLVQLPGQSLSTVETVLLAVFAAFVVASAWRRVMPVWRTPLTLPWVAVLVAMLAASALATQHQANAIHMAGRLALAFGVYLVTVNAITSESLRLAVLVVAVASGSVAAALAILEYAGAGPVLELLGAFRAGVAHVGAQVRATGPFQYPTIASMFLEIIFAFALGLQLFALDARRAGRRNPTVVALTLIVLLVAQATILTFTRAGLVTMASSLVIVGALRYRRRGLDAAVKTVALLAALIAVQFFAVRPAEAVRLRLTTEGQNSWYRAYVDAPLRLSMTTGSMNKVPITLTNTGLSTWDSAAAQPFLLTNHWLLADEDRVVSWQGQRTAFPAPVRANERVTLTAQVGAPRQPGEYRLLWDIEQHNRLWFTTEPDAQLFISRVSVSGPSMGSSARIQTRPLPTVTARPGRLVLWRAAGRMLLAHPLFGVGPDNFRLLYGEYGGLARADSRVHSNNMYIELLAGGGLVGGLALAWFFWRAAANAVLLIDRSLESQAPALWAGILAAVVAIAVHGVVDTFLGFTGTYVLIAVALGLMVARGGREANADRI